MYALGVACHPRGLSELPVRAELDRVLKVASQRYVSAMDIASIDASLGENDDAMLWARFVALVQRVGLWKRPLTP